MNFSLIVFTICALTLIPKNQTLVAGSGDFATSNDDKNNEIIVLVHGISSNIEKLSDFQYALLKEGYNVFVPNLLANETNGVLNMNFQLYLLDQEIDNYLNMNNFNINNFNFVLNMIGISQGGLLCRAYIQYFNKYNVKNLITIGTPHGGVYYNLLHNYTIFYNFWTQLAFAPANYWRDPFNYNMYLHNSMFLSSLNNEVLNLNYVRNINNLRSLNNFVMVWSPNDGVLSPPESGKFSTYAVMNSSIYSELLVLDYKDAPYYNSLQLYNVNISTEEVDCYHTEYITNLCLDNMINIINNYLKGT